MTVDMTAELMPIFWGMIVLLLVLSAGILASVDPDLAEIYLGGPRLWVFGATAAVVALVTLGVLGGPSLGVTPPW